MFINACTNILSMLLFFITGRYFFSFQHQGSSYRALFFLILTGILSPIFSLIDNLMLLLCLYILYIWYVMCKVYRTSPRMLFVYSCVLYIIFTLFIQFICIIINTLLKLTQHKSKDSIITLLATCIMVLTFFLIGKSSEKKMKNKLQCIDKKYIFLFLFVLVVDCVIVLKLGDFALSTYIKKNHLLFESIYFLVVIGIFFQLFLMVALIISRNTYREKEALATQYLNEQQQHYAYLKNRERETRKFRHDLKSHMFVLTSLYEKQEFAQIGSYLETMKEKINTLNTPINVRNEIADAILNKFYYEGKEQGIQLHVQGHFPSPCKISAYDLCTILSNLLNNAMQAQAKCKGGEINVGIHYSTTEIILTIDNQYLQKPLRDHDKFYTRKKDTANHGFGLENVKECVEQNHGHISIETEHNQFSVLLSLRNS